MSEILEQENAVVLAAAEKMVSLGQDISERVAAGKQNKDKYAHGVQILRLLTAYKNNTYNDDDLEAVLYSLKELSEASLFPTVDPIVGQDLVYLVEGGSGSGSMIVQNNGSTLALRDTINFYNGLFASDDGSIINVGIGGNLTIDATIGLGSANLTIDAGGSGDFALNLGSDAIGDTYHRNASGKMARLASVAAGSFLRSGGVATIPAWSTTTYPNSATIGDILYASATNVYSNLADVATGNALISGGVGVAPLWGKIALTTHISGILPVANGGTGVATIAAKSIWLANSLDTITSVTPGAGQSIRINAGNTAWEAYTAGDMMLASAQTSTGKKSFTTDATNAGINIISVAGNPSSPANGDLWVNSSASHFYIRIAGVSYQLDQQSTSPAGADTQIQFNNSGAFGAVSTFTWNVGSQYMQIGTSTRARYSAAGIDVNSNYLVSATGTLDLFGSGNVSLQSNAAITIGSGSTTSLTSSYKHSFSTTATLAPINLSSLAGNPSSLSNYDLWFNSSAGHLYARIGGVSYQLDQQGGGGDMILASVQTSTGKKTFQPDATNYGINVGVQSSLPSSPANGDITYRSGSVHNYYGVVNGTQRPFLHGSINDGEIAFGSPGVTNILTGDPDLTFSGNTLAVTNIDLGTVSISGNRTITVKSSTTDSNLTLIGSQGNGVFTLGGADIDITATNFVDITTSPLRISNLTSGRVVIIGTSGVLQDDSDLTFDGSFLKVGTSWLSTVNVITGADGSPFRIKGGDGVVGTPTGNYLEVQGGPAYASGNTNGGAVYINGGQKNGSGVNGDVIIGSDQSGAVLSRYLILKNIPTSSAGLPSDAIWSNSGVLTKV